MNFALNFTLSFALNFVHIADKRLQHLPFTSVESVITIVTLYLLFVLKWGPKFMEKRKPFNIERILLFYNFFQVICNFSILAYVSATKLWLKIMWNWNFALIYQNQLILWFYATSSECGISNESLDIFILNFIFVKYFWYFTLFTPETSQTSQKNNCIYPPSVYITNFNLQYELKQKKKW